MASFCGTCGFPLGANGAFCPQCGKRSAGASPTPAPPVAQAPASKSSGLKILAGVLACLLVVGVAVAGVAAYVAYRVKHAIVAKAESYGVDLGVAHAAKTSAHRPAARRACDLLSKQEVSALLGEPIVRTEVQDESCLYFAPPGRSTQLAKEQTEAEFKHIQTGDSKSQGEEGARTVQELVRGLGAVSGKGVGGEDPPLLTFIVDLDGKTQMAALQASGAIFGKIPAVSREVPNLGDRAIAMKPLGLNVLKGETLLRIIVAPMPEAEEKDIAIAKLVLPKI